MPLLYVACKLLSPSLYSPLSAADLGEVTGPCNSPLIVPRPVHVSLTSPHPGPLP